MNAVRGIEVFRDATSVERCFRSSGSPWNPFQYGARPSTRLHSIRQSVGQLRQIETVRETAAVTLLW